MSATIAMEINLATSERIPPLAPPSGTTCFNHFTQKLQTQKQSKNKPAESQAHVLFERAAVHAPVTSSPGSANLVPFALNNFNIWPNKEYKWIPPSSIHSIRDKKLRLRSLFGKYSAHVCFRLATRGKHLMKFSE